MAVSPEESGLCGCWQFIAVWRERQELRQGKVVDTQEEYQFYCASLARDEHTAPELLEIIRGHWSACEIGAHYRRDVTLGEDASQIRKAAQPMATLRNLVLGLRLSPANLPARFFAEQSRRCLASGTSYCRGALGFASAQTNRPSAADPSSPTENL